jgi:hypothetical protein
VSRSRTVSLLILSLTYFIQASHAQQSETGFPVYGSFHGGGIDNVNLANGNPHVEIPIISVPQRQGPNVTYKFMYDARSWEINKSQPTPSTFQWNVNLANGEFVDWHLVTDPAHPVYYRYDIVPKSCTYVNFSGTYTNYYRVLTNYVVVDNHGTRHTFEVRHVQQPASGCQDLTGDQQTGMALDGSGITLDIGGNGTTPSFKWADDLGQFNGNIGLDTLGRTLLSSTVQKDANGVEVAETWTVKDSNGTSQTFRVDYAQVSLQTNFCGL